ASSLAQNSTCSAKSLYASLLTRYAGSLLVRLSATTAPSSTRQLVSPTLFQPSRLVPSSSTVQPGPSWAWTAGGAATATTRARAEASAVPRDISFSPGPVVGVRIVRLFPPGGHGTAGQRDLGPGGAASGRAAPRPPVVAHPGRVEEVDARHQPVEHAEASGVH